MKILIYSTLFLCLIGCGGPKEIDERTKEFAKAAEKSWVAKMRTNFNEEIKRCPKIDWVEMTEAQADSIQAACTNDELYLFSQTIACAQKITCEDDTAFKACLGKTDSASDKCNAAIKTPLPTQASENVPPCCRHKH
ncbi:MAG: hypothetical protein WCK42_01860 [Myxococcaceae bacterium]